MEKKKQDAETGRKISIFHGEFIVEMPKKGCSEITASKS